MSWRHSLGHQIGMPEAETASPHAFFETQEGKTSVGCRGGISEVSYVLDPVPPSDPIAKNSGNCFVDTTRLLNTEIKPT